MRYEMVVVVVGWICLLVCWCQEIDECFSPGRNSNVCFIWKLRKLSWIDMKRWWMSPFATEISFRNDYRFWPSQCNECRRHCSLHPPFSNLINYLLSFVILWTFSVESAKASWNLPSIEINHVLNLFWN